MTHDYMTAEKAGYNVMFCDMIEDSISPEGYRLRTMHVRYPKIIHGEMMTHREMSRNAGSSRAIPTAKLLKHELYIPTFLRNQKGMQGGDELGPEEQEMARQIWVQMADACKDGVEKLNALGVHKQHANRPLEWFTWIDVLLTSTSFSNFFALRNHPDAQPEICQLAKLMLACSQKSRPRRLAMGDWHLPYVTMEERRSLPIETCCRISVARCARVSYHPFEGEGNIALDISLFKKLVGGCPLHASPAEHQAMPDYKLPSGLWANPDKHGNLKGYQQLRKWLPNEYISEYPEDTFEAASTITN